MRFPRVCVVASLLAYGFACGGSDPPPPGYLGSVPGARGQFALSELQGRTFVDSTGAFGGGEWTVGPFGVVPNPTSEKGPVVRLTRGTDERWLPIETDGDVADFVRRVTGRDSELVVGQTSVAYRNVMKIGE